MERAGGRLKVSVIIIEGSYLRLIRFVAEMAGNIIPAIATTNAIISGLIVLQALQLLQKSYNTLRNIHLQFKPTNPLSTIVLCPPNPHCGVCRDTFVEVMCDPRRTTLAEVVNGILGGEGVREVSVYEDNRILADPDWSDNLERTLDNLNVTRGKFLSIVDDDGGLETITVGISNLP
jgi:ubiquitin-like 1-activating enzyme E1 B